MKSLTYLKSGVDMKRADRLVKEIKKTSAKSKINKTAAFGSLFDFSVLLKKYKKPLLVSSTDGVGTKLLLAQQFKIHNTVGIDLVAMNVNDIVCLGAKPLFFLDYIACGKVNVSVLASVVVGINKGLGESDCKLIGGETAEMPGMYGRDEYDLAGFCLGVVDKSKALDASKIKKGDLIIGLESSGPHSNGFSLIRKALSRSELKKYHKELLKPTRIYVKSILSTLGKYPSAIRAIAHVTGGAFYNKVTKVLPSGLGMLIDKKSWKVPNIFKLIQKKAKVSDKEMYTVFNMGIGMVLVVDKKKAKNIKTFLSKKCKAHIIGEIVKSKKKMDIL